MSDDKITESLWRRGNLSYKLHGNQHDIYTTMRESTDKKTVILAARRFGKSYLSAIFALEEGIRNPDSRIILLAPDKTQAYGIYTPILKSISQDAPKGFIRPTKSESKWYVGESELIFAGFDTIAESLRGGGTILVIIDEAGFVNIDEFEYVTKSILYPMLQKTIGKKQGRQIYISTPAKTPDHPFNVLWEQTLIEGKLKKYTIYDNPILTELDIAEIIKEQGGADSVGFRREYMCENVRDTGGLIIPKFEPRHVLGASTSIPTYPTKWLVGDIGGIRDKSALLVFGRVVTDNKIVILHEIILEPNTDVTEIGRTIRDLQKAHDIMNYHIWIDAHGQTLVDLQQMCGISATLPPKQDKDGAIAALNAAFYRDDIFISNSCDFTVKSFKNCMFNDKRTDFLRSEAYGHADAIMAAVYGYRVAQYVQELHTKQNKNFFGQTTSAQSSGVYATLAIGMKKLKHGWRK